MRQHGKLHRDLKVHPGQTVLRVLHRAGEDGGQGLQQIVLWPSSGLRPDRSHIQPSTPRPRIRHHSSNFSCVRGKEFRKAVFASSSQSIPSAPGWQLSQACTASNGVHWTPIPTFTRTRINSWQTGWISSGWQIRREKKLLELLNCLWYSLDRKRHLLVTGAS